MNPQDVVYGRCGYPDGSLERFHEVVDDAVEFIVCLAVVLDFPNRVNDGAVMLAAKSATNLRKRVGG